jgi:hypothetical protein
MRFLTAAALSGLTVISVASVDAAHNSAEAQSRQLKQESPSVSVTHGMAPADALARALQQREQVRKRQARQEGAQADIKTMFQQRQSAFDQRQDLERSNTKAKNDLIRSLQK